MTDQTIHLTFNDYKLNNKKVQQSTTPEDDPFKKKILETISKIIDENKWTQTVAAAKLNVDQPKISQIKNNKVSGFSLERLLTFLIRLNCKVELVINKKGILDQ